MAKKIRVMVVDDSRVVRQALQDILASDDEIEVMATAADPYQAAAELEKDIPDVITLDIEMPKMDGLTFLKKIMTQHPIPVVICSRLASDGTMETMKAMEYGAVEIIHKPNLSDKNLIRESTILICDAVKAAAKVKVDKLQNQARQLQKKLTADVILPPPTGKEEYVTTEKVIVIGSSTGGIDALCTIVKDLPANSSGIVIVQHMPKGFTRILAERLGSISPIPFKEAGDGDPVLKGHGLVAPGDIHTLLKRQGNHYTIELKNGPLVCRHRPSVDVLFRSASRYAGKNAIGVILSGMGDDGARGMLEMKQMGALTIAQDEESCVVFGMPKVAINLNGVDEVLPLNMIAARISSEGSKPAVRAGR